MANCGCNQYDHVGTTGRSVNCTTWQEIVPDDTTPHSAGDVVSEQLAFACAIRTEGGTARLVEVVLAEEGDNTNTPVKPDLTLILYQSSETVAPQNDPYVAPDPLTSVIGVVEIASSDWSDLDPENAFALVQKDVTYSAADGTTTIYGVIVTPGTPSWSDNSVQKLHIQLRIARD